MTYILYLVWFNAVQTQKERIKCYIRTLKHDKRGSSQFSPFKNKFTAQDITGAVKKKSFLFVNADMRNVVEEYFLPRKEEVKDLIFLKLYLLYHTI